MNIKQLEKQIGTLSNPSKMPSYAWGIPIHYCITGSILAEQDELCIHIVCLLIIIVRKN